VLSEIVLDQPTATTLYHLATGLAHGLDILMEGETGTSKTCLIGYLAALAGREVTRFNLSNTTDSGELLAGMSRTRSGRCRWTRCADTATT